MLSPLGSIIALLLGTAFLLTGSGLHGLLLPLRGQMEGFPTASLGALGAAWAAGFVAGCFVAPRIVRRAGHVRAFGAFAASGAIIALLTGMWVDPAGWVILRIFTGFTMAGAFMVIESWLNEKSTNENRGTVFGIYMMLTYGSLTAGQMTVAFGDVSSTILFMTTGILFCMALIPTAVSKAVSPEPLTQASLDLKGLYVNSPVAFLGCVLVGIANGAWGTLGAVYGGQIGISTLQIATMMSIAVLAGAALQLPAGRLSDRMDRRFVISGAAFGSGLVGLLILLTAPRDGIYVIAMTGVYGAFAYTLYSIIVAHANDHASPEDFVKVASGLLFLYGFGTMIGPLIGGVLMEIMPPESLFLITALAHFGLGAYALLRISQRAPVPVDEREAFKTLPAERAVTPQAAVLDPRSDTDESLTDTVE
ncbi:Predicted arabinose efflux permease, MFS family [Nitratireductor aquibiodomus]|uniref:Predicted arabinose efflux permease, MFS family n=1 Tax=Nitratireductor aquibiodomus TaxID=204799 RepID=A0A1H4KCE5_9HYPH|nr:MFS transporter [Nitratireductor aquibiodomus]SEB56209.1 Predicted arabinose efflux permease, MFS family [Nitratireductor aquibiodomus]